MATEREIALVQKVVSTAEAGLLGLESMIKEWPAEFRAIMWEAVADIAARRAVAARGEGS